MQVCHIWNCKETKKWAKCYWFKETMVWAKTASESTWGTQKFLGMPLVVFVVFALYTEVLTNVVCPWCTLALAMLWLCLWYTTVCHRSVTKPTTVVMVCCMRLMCCLSVICFCPTDEQTFFLDYDRGEPEFLLWIIICEYHLLYAGLRLLHLKSYTACMYYVFIFIQDIFTAQIFANMF